MCKQGSDSIRVRDSEKTMIGVIDCRSFGVKDTRRKKLKKWQKTEIKMLQLGDYEEVKLFLACDCGHKWLR